MSMALNKANLADPVNAFSEILLTFAVYSMTSPSRINLGALGTTINSFWVIISFSVKANFKSFVWAKPWNFHRVRASFIVKEIMIFPSASVFKSGLKNTVSFKFVLTFTSEKSVPPPEPSGLLGSTLPSAPKPAFSSALAMLSSKAPSASAESIAAISIPGGGAALALDFLLAPATVEDIV